MKILALDLGTNLGWAHGESGKLVTDCGTYVLAEKKEITAFRKERYDRRLDPRITRLWFFLKRMHESWNFDWIVFEDVKFASTTLQAHLWASLRGVVWVFASEFHIPTECIDTSGLKLFATGHGGADKPAMARALVHVDPRFTINVEKQVQFDGHAKNFFLTDDAVDAVHLLKWAQKILANTKPKNQ